MLFAEISSILYVNMADAFANLSKHEQIAKAVATYVQEPNKLSVTKTDKVYRVISFIIIRRINK